MGKTVLKENWRTQKGNLKHKLTNLTDNDLMDAEGKGYEIFGRTQRKHRKTRKEIE